MIDQSLVGTWNNGGAATVVILRSGELFYSAQTFSYTLEDNGQTLVTEAPSGPESYGRVGGGGVGLAGIWQRTTMQTDGTWTEEINLRDDGSYSLHWTHNGASDTDHFGLLTDNGTEFILDERKGWLWTGPAQELSMSMFWSPLLTGTYSLAPDGNSFTFFSNVGDIIYVRI